MKTDLSLSQLANELESRAALKNDYVTDTRNIAMDDAGAIILNDNRFQPNQIAHNQIANRLNIPVKYYDKMREKAPALLASNVNNWFQTEPEKRLVRTLGNDARAFLSDRYNRIENEDIARVALPELLSQPDIRIESSSITDSKMYIKAVFPRIQGEVTKGDIVQSGIVISNSEVGHGRVSIQALVFRLVCLNGMINADSSFGVRHVGSKLETSDEITALLSNEALKADDHAIMLKVRDVIRASFDETAFTRTIEKMRESTEQRIEGNPVEAVKVLSKRLLISEAEQGDILRHLIEGASLTRYGLLNAVTRTAQDSPSYDRATELESLGGVILNLPVNDWQQVAMAA